MYFIYFVQCENLAICIYLCKFRNFHENFIFANSVKGHICDIKNSRLEHNLPISPFPKVFLLPKP